MRRFLLGGVGGEQVVDALGCDGQGFGEGFVVVVGACLPFLGVGEGAEAVVVGVGVEGAGIGGGGLRF